MPSSSAPNILATCGPSYSYSLSRSNISWLQRSIFTGEKPAEGAAEGRLVLTGRSQQNKKLSYFDFFFLGDDDGLFCFLSRISPALSQRFTGFGRGKGVGVDYELKKGGSVSSLFVTAFNVRIKIKIITKNI
jgi:hypothetical protein